MQSGILILREEWIRPRRNVKAKGSRSARCIRGEAWGALFFFSDKAV